MRSSAASVWLKRIMGIFALMLVQILLVPQAHAQHTSGECPPQTATVTAGGTVTINISDCELPGFGGLGAIDGGSFGTPDFENHGTAITRRVGSGPTTQWFLDYSHNGTTGIGSTDVFELSDGSLTGSGDIQFTITINASASPITVAPSSLPTITAGTFFSQTLTATGGASPYTYVLQSGAFPVGLSLSSGGVLSGTPTQRGAYSFSVRATDSTTPTAQFTDKGYTGTVQSPTLALSPGTYAMSQGVSGSFSIGVSGGVAPYSFLVEPVPPNALPPGLSLSASGVVSGTPTSSGSFNTTIRVGDASTGPGTYFELETLTINVAPPPSVSIAVAPSSVNEDGATNLTYTVTRSATSTSALTVNLSYSGTATSGSDYTGAAATVVIPANATTATLTLDPTADTTSESNETAIVTVAAGTGYTVGAPSSATGTILNDEGTSTYPGCATRNVTVANGGTVRVDLSACHFFGLGVVSVAPTNGTATAGPGPVNYYDYTHNGNSATSDRFVVLDDNSQTIVINVTITPPTSSIVVLPASLSAMTAGTAFSEALTSSGGTGPYTYTVSTGALPTGLSLSSTGVISGTPTQRGSYSVGIRAQDSLGAFTVKGYTGTVAAASLTLVSGTGTAIQSVAFTQTLATTNGVAPFTYLVETGSLPSGITLSSAGVLSGTTSAAAGPYSVTIRVTDSSTGVGTNFQLQPFTLTVSPPPTVSIAVTPASVSEDGATNLTYTVTRSLNLSSPTTVNITTAGTATSGVDYTGGVATVVIPANATTATITINPSVDGSVEPDETVTLIVAAGTGYSVGAPSNAVGTILNDDVPSATIAVSPAAVAEDGAPNLVYTVTLSQAPNSPVSINYTVGGTAANGTDYATITSPLIINTGQTTGTITVNPTADTSIESDETVSITLAAGAGYTVGVPNNAVGTILNDDLPNLTINDVTLNEGNAGITNATFTVSLSAPAGPGGVTFNIATANGSATAGTDYVAQSLTAQTIPAGSSTYIFTVLLNGDTLNEPSESYFVNVTSAVNAVVVDGQGVGTITNDDPLPSLSINDVSVTEGNAGTVNAVFTVNLSAASGQTVAVNYATANGTATQPADYTNTSGTLTFTPGQTSRTITVPVIGETVPEANETYFVNLSGATNAIIADNQGLGTINNDDVPVTVSPGSLPNGTVGTAYSQTLTASAGVAPYSFAVTAGALPTGLTLTGGGTLSGTPTASGVFNFTVSATDSSGAPGPFSGSQAYALTIVSPPIIANDDTGAAAVNGFTGGTAYADVLANNGNGPDTLGGVPATLTTVTLSQLATTNPAITLNPATGAVVVAPATAAGSYTVTYEICQAVDPANCAAAIAEVSVAPAAIAALDDVNAPDISTVTGGTAYANILANNGNGPDTLNGAAATFANVVVTSSTSSNAGVTLNPATGRINVAVGTPVGSQSVNYTICEQLNPTNCASAVASVTVIDIPPVAGPVTLTVPYDAAATNVPLVITGGAPTSVNEVTPSLHGTVMASGTTITYQPNPGYAGPDSFTYSATNSGGTSSAALVSITVQDPVVTITPSGGLNASIAVPYTQSFTFNGGAQPWSGYQVTNLPAGLSITGTTANSVTVSGTPTAAGAFNLNVSATDSSSGNGPFTVGQAFTLNVAGPGLALIPGSGTLNAPYAAAFSQNFTASGGTGPYSYTLTGALPAGLSFSGSTLSGTPTAPGSYPVTVTATDTGSTGTGAPFTVAQNYTIDVPAPTIAIAPAVVPAANAGVAYSQTLTSSGGVAPYTLALTSGSLPTGLTFSAGTLSGTPTQVGSFNFTITSTDNFGQAGSRAYTLTVNAPTLVLTPGSGTTNVAFNAPVSQTYVASGGVGPYSYAVTAGALPTGVTLNGSTGLLSGSTIQVGTFSFTVTATDTTITGVGAPFSVSGNYALTVAPPVIAIDQASLPSATVASAYSTTVTASGAIAPYSYAITAGALPAGLSLSSGGTLSGTPTAGGNFNFTITATDSSGTPGPFNGARAFTLNVASASVTLPATSLASGQRNVPYAATLNPASGGTAPYSYVVTAGALPTGMTLSASGVLGGTPTAFGSFSFTVTATDSSTGTGPYGGNQSFALTIVDQPPVAGAVSLSLPYGSGATPVALNLSGGTATSVAIASGPANGSATVGGLTVSYQPNASFSGTDSFTYTATNSGGTSSPATVTITVGAPALTVTAAGPLTTTVGQAYSQTFNFAGGTAPFSAYTVTGLPAGLSVSSSSANSVTIAGTPTASGSFALTVSGQDSSTGNGPFTASQGFTLNVAAPNLALAPASGSFTATYAGPYSQSIAASGGVGPYSYALTGSLPAGVTLNAATGAVSGTPTASGSFAFTVTATDTGATGAGAPFTVAGNYSLTVAAPTIVVTPTALPAAIAGQAYTATLSASGAVAPYSYTLTGGALPTGVTLAANGQLSGTPTVSGSFAFAVQVRDANGQTGAANLTLGVGVPTLTITPATLPAAVQGIAYSQALTASGGIAPYSFAISSGTLPAGLTLNTTTGVISGTPTTSGTANFAITATDSTGGTPATLTVNFALQVAARPDPATDPEVRGLVQAQVAATRRFADAQVDNFMQRMESMHGEGSGNGEGNGDGAGITFRNNVRLSTPDHCRDAITMMTNAACANRSRMSGIVSLNNWSAEGSAKAEGPTANAGAGGGAGGPWTIWAGGAIRFGEREANSGRVSQEFESEGITIGADYRFSPSFAAGLGIGLGRDTVDVGDEGSRSRGEAKTIAVYGSHKLGDGFFVDWLGGYQKLDFDLRRYVTLTGALLNSSRDGHQWFGTLSTGADILRGDWQLTPYARIDITRATLNGYSESSGSVFDLTFLDQDVNFTSLGLGTRFKYRHKTGWGELLPQLRAEYQWNVERSADARVAYADRISGPFSTIPLSGIGSEELTLGGKLEALFDPNWALAVEYIGRISPGAGSDNMFQIGVKHEF
ncbi:putative Ig domain-containing protein [Sphingorhabdus pulchriflava]|nr:putative Ig domain-containing protein [Sphingorhabdus pulchriflava]